MRCDRCHYTWFEEWGNYWEATWRAHWNNAAHDQRVQSQVWAFKPTYDAQIKATYERLFNTPGNAGSPGFYGQYEKAVKDSLAEA